MKCEALESGIWRRMDAFEGVKAIKCIARTQIDNHASDFRQKPLNSRIRTVVSAGEYVRIIAADRPAESVNRHAAARFFGKAPFIGSQITTRAKRNDANRHQPREQEN